MDTDTGDEASLAAEGEEATSPPDVEDPASTEDSEAAQGTGAAGEDGEDPEPDEPDAPPSPEDDAVGLVPQGDMPEDEGDDKDEDGTPTEPSNGAGEAGEATAQGEDDAKDTDGSMDDTPDVDGSSQAADGENDADTSGEDGEVYQEPAAVTGDEFEPPDEEGDDDNNLQRLASESQALAKVLSLPMPDDPISTCSPSKINSLYDVARREAPDIFNACTNLVVVRICCLLPTLVIFALGSVWGYELYGKLSQGYLVPFIPAQSTQARLPVFLGRAELQSIANRSA